MVSDSGVLNDVVQGLTLLDERLSSPESICLCGSVVPVLLGLSSKEVRDIDFAFLPSMVVQRLVSEDVGLSLLFDLSDQGVVGLFHDVEDRLQLLSFPFKHLRVYCLSLQDWVVSQLGTPNFKEVRTLEGVTLEMLYWIRDNFHLYAGVSPVVTLLNLQCLIELKEFECNVEST